MNDTSPVRISFIGAGGICEQRHLPNLQQLPGVELVAVCNRSLESSQRSKEKWGFARAEKNWRKVINDPQVEAIFIGTWPYMHRKYSLAALAAGKHVFCQARLSLDWRDAKMMAAAAQASPQLVSMVCPSPFRVRWERTVKQVLTSPEFGELQAVAVRSLSAANANPQQLTWREMTGFSGLNILQVGIYAETLHAWCGEYETLSATTSIPLPQKILADGSAHDVHVPQIVSLSGRLKNGALVNEFHSGLAAGDEGRITLFGSRGTCLVDVLAGRVSLQAHGATNANVIDDTGDPWLVEAEFLTAVRAARRSEPFHVRPNFVEASRYMLKMQALHKSARTNSTVRLDQYAA